MTVSASDIVGRLDDRPAPAKARREIAYRILGETNRRDELVDAILEQYRIGFPDERLLQTLKERLSERRMGPLGLVDEPLLHISWGLFPDEESLDGYLAEYYYDWADKLGIPEGKVSNILLELGLPAA